MSYLLGKRGWSGTYSHAAEEFGKVVVVVPVFGILGCEAMCLEILLKVSLAGWVHGEVEEGVMDSVCGSFVTC